MELQEKIDNYILDRLNPSEKTEFENSLSNDATLKNEVALQRSISNALNQSGSLALKAKLNSMPVSMASTGNALLMKWVGAGVAASLLAGFIIFLLPSQEEYQSKNHSTTEVIQSVASSNSTESQETNTIQNSTVIESNQLARTAETSKEASTNTTAKKSSVNEDIVAYKETNDFSDMNNGDITHASQSSVVPSSNLTSESNKLSSLSVTVDSSNPADKSYLFTGSKLTLFGNFSQFPYEMLELNNKGQKALFLSYQNEFYELAWGKSTKSPLKKVSDKNTIEKLKQINH
jgi:hypothetical protein